MLMDRRGLIVLACITCLASAFSTRFVIEGLNEAKNPLKVEETKSQNTEENVPEKPLWNEGMAVEVVPIVTDVFTQTDDLLGMTPLKLVTAISAQHLLTTIKNIPAAGNSFENIMEMFGGIVQEFNRTAQIIKLTAEYVNISSHYILSTLNQYEKNSCEGNLVEKSIKSVKENFLKTLSKHIKTSVKELNEKTKGREMAGGDILVSAAYHIVSAFQEMTNQVLNLASESTKTCKTPPPSIEITRPSEEQQNGFNKENVFNIQHVRLQGKPHKSIKKDQAIPLEKDDKITFLNLGKPLDDMMTIENLNPNQDLTVEVFSPETFLKANKNKLDDEKKEDNNKLKVPEDLKVDNIPFTVIYANSKDDKLKDVKTESAATEKYIDKELASSLVDSLSNIPWISSETETKNLNDNKNCNVENKFPSTKNVLGIEQLLSGDKLAPQTKHCDDSVMPVCGIDSKENKFIIFLNDCKREAHNEMYGTNYNWFNMDICVGLFMKNPNLRSSLTPDKQAENVDLKPR